MKKILVLIFGLMTTIGASAQYSTSSEKVFYEGKWMIGASTSGVGIGYKDYDNDWNVSLQAKAGYLFIDDWMITANVGYQYYGESSFQIGAGLRYYFEENGIYLGLTGNYKNQEDDFVPELGVGYAFFLSRHITIEPEAYVEYGFNNASLGAGVRLGFSLYF